MGSPARNTGGIPARNTGGIPARNSQGERLLLYVGIIDVLQSYRLSKKLEHAVKSVVYDAVSMRSV